MNTVRRALARLRKSQAGGLAGDSLWTAVWLGAVAVADLLQIALVTHTLGIAEYGRLALVMSVVVLVGQFFDVRVGTAETTFGAGKLAARDWDGMSAVFRFGYAVDAVTGVAAFVIVAVTSVVVGPALVGEGGALLIVLYGLTLLASTVDESSVTVLRLLGRFKLLAKYMSGLELARIGFIVAALSIDRSLTAVLIALLAYDVLAALVNAFVARREYRVVSGRPLVRLRERSVFGERGAMTRTVLSTNVVSYARIAQVQAPTLLLGSLTTPGEVGLYKVGTAAASVLGRITAPAYASVLPRLSRLWSEGRYREIRALLRETTPIAAVVAGAFFVLLIVYREPILHALGGEEATSAAAVLTLAAIGFLAAAVVFWYPALMFAIGRPGGVALIAVMTTVLQLGLLIPLTARWGAGGAALALCVTMVLTNIAGGWASFRAMGRMVRTRRAPGPSDAQVVGPSLVHLDTASRSTT